MLEHESLVTFAKDFLASIHCSTIALLVWRGLSENLKKLWCSAVQTHARAPVGAYESCFHCFIPWVYRLCLDCALAEVSDENDDDESLILVTMMINH